MVAFAVVGLFASPAQAQMIFDCSGEAPDWTLSLTETDARFEFAGRNLSYEIPQSSRAEGQDWPRAFTLIAEFDSAIALIDETACGAGSHKAAIFTQRGETPILLSGCCELRND